MKNGDNYVGNYQVLRASIKAFDILDMSIMMVQFTYHVIQGKDWFGRFSEEDPQDYDQSLF